MHVSQLQRFEMWCTQTALRLLLLHRGYFTYKILPQNTVVLLRIEQWEFYWEDGTCYYTTKLQEPERSLTVIYLSPDMTSVMSFSFPLRRTGSSYIMSQLSSYKEKPLFVPGANMLVSCPATHWGSKHGCDSQMADINAHGHLRSKRSIIRSNPSLTLF